jgi:hypothetical protein
MLRGAIAALLLAAVGWVGSAQATDDAHERAQAREQFDTGTKAFAAHRYREAARAFEAACAYQPNPVASYTAAMAWERADAPDRAADDYVKALATPGLSEADAAEARNRLDALQKTLGMIDVTGPAGTIVVLDGHSEAKVPARLHGTAGKHVVVVRSADEKVSHRVVLLRVGEVSKLDLLEVTQAAASASCPRVLPSPSETDASLQRQPPMSIRNVLGVGFIGVAVAATGAAVLLGSEALGARDAYNAHPTRGSFDHASSMQLGTNVVWVTAAVFAAGGATLLLWPRRSDASSKANVGLTPVLGGMSMRGEW